MHRSNARNLRRTAPLALPLNSDRDGRFAIVLVTLLSLATLCVVATTNVISRQHAQEISSELKR